MKNKNEKNYAVIVFAEFIRFYRAIVDFIVAVISKEVAYANNSNA